MTTDRREALRWREAYDGVRGAMLTVAQWDSWASEWLAKHPEPAALAADAVTTDRREALRAVIDAWTPMHSGPCAAQEDDAECICGTSAAYEAALALAADFVPLDDCAELREWVGKRKARDKRSRDRYRAAHPDVHRISARESMARTRARRLTEGPR